jgi:hypothetical protein
VVDDISIDNEALLVIDFMNLKISRSSLSDVLIGIECVCVYVPKDEYSYVYKYLRLCCVS